MMQSNMQYSVTESIGDRLKQSRQSRGYSQAKFAATLGVPSRTYLGWEYNNYEPSARGLKALHAIHRIDLHWLLNGGQQSAASTKAKSFDADRLRRIFCGVIKVFEEAGAKLAAESILNISLAIYHQDPVREDNELQTLRIYVQENRRTKGS
jgi:transcriptional regulator with XRE-family HTH domain